jgi:hypothetical protein
MPVYPLRRTGTKPLDGARKIKSQITIKSEAADRPDWKPYASPVGARLAGECVLTTNDFLSGDTRKSAPARLPGKLDTLNPKQQFIALPQPIASIPLPIVRAIRCGWVF